MKNGQPCYASEISANNILYIACKEVVSKKKEILEVGFDCSWSKVQEALQAKYANLINIISKITPTFCEYNIVLNVGVDGDLSTNKTLAEEKIIHKIFADLKHKSKLLRNKI
ncbi:22669_t:CDS:2, partial [Gigaspora margarita]